MEMLHNPDEKSVYEKTAVIGMCDKVSTKVFSETELRVLVFTDDPTIFVRAIGTVELEGELPVPFAGCQRVVSASMAQARGLEADEINRDTLMEQYEWFKAVFFERYILLLPLVSSPGNLLTCRDNMHELHFLLRFAPLMTLQ